MLGHVPFGASGRPWINEFTKEAIVTRDQLIREYRMPGLVGFYLLIVATMVLSALAIT